MHNHVRCGENIFVTGMLSANKVLANKTHEMFSTLFTVSGYKMTTTHGNLSCNGLFTGIFAVRIN